MGYVGNIAQFIMDEAGFTFKRDDKLTFPTALVDGSKNINFFEGGISKRGGTTKTIASPNSTIGRGLYNFRLRNGNSFIVFGTAEGKIYHTNYSNVIATGTATSNYYNFCTFNNECYVADGSTVPKYWTGGGVFTAVTPATSWAAEQPFQLVPHSRGANARLWAVTTDSIWASKNNDGHDFSDAEVKQIPIYTEGGLVGAIDFGGQLIAYSKTKAYLVDDTDIDPDNWGYSESIWEGGGSHNRLVVQAGNNVYVWTDEGLVYTIQGIQGTGDYAASSVTRPAFVDRWIREKVTRANVYNFNASYDRTLRCINYFVQVAGSTNNTCLKYFIDRSPETAWIIEDNTSYNSGFNAAASCEVFVSSGVYKIYTQDYSGQIWAHEQTTNTDDSNAYLSRIKFKPFDFGNLQMYKHFKSGAIRCSSQSNFGLTIHVYVDGQRKNDIVLDVSGTGAVFDDPAATFDTAVFADGSQLVSVPFSLNYYGFQIQFEIENEVAGQDFFISEMLINFKNQGVRTA